MTAEFRLFLHLLLAFSEDLLKIQSSGSLDAIGDDIFIVILFYDIFEVDLLFLAYALH